VASFFHPFGRGLNATGKVRFRIERAAKLFEALEFTFRYLFATELLLPPEAFYPFGIHMTTDVCDLSKMLGGNQNIGGKVSLTDAIAGVSQ